MKKKTVSVMFTIFILSAMIISCAKTETNENTQGGINEPDNEVPAMEALADNEVSQIKAEETATEPVEAEDAESDEDSKFEINDPDLELTVTEGTEYYEGFQVDNILHFSDGLPDLYYHLYVPDSYDGSKPYALYIALPGHGGYYYDGEGSAKNITEEYYAVQAKAYNDEMIIAAPQPEDYDGEMELIKEESEIHKPQVIRLTEYLLSTYNIDRDRVYISGYSRGGEVMSLIVTERPELYTAALHLSSMWRGDTSVVASEHFPVYFAIGESDDYYGSEPVKKTYEEISSVYKQEGMSEDEMEKLVVLDVKDADYFTSQGYDSQHIGADLFAYESSIMGWLLNHD